LIDFAVFVSGLVYVMQRLFAFMVAVIIFLICFAQLFFTVFRQTGECEYDERVFYYTDTWLNNSTELETCEPTNDHPFCSFWTSFLKVYTMLLGEVDETLFVDKSQIGLWIFVLFMFIMVVLLANVLIAIVTDSYGVIKNERAAIVFWSNRLDFVAEMDVISNNINWCQLRDQTDYDDIDGGFGSELWKKFMFLYNNEIDERDDGLLESFFYAVLRVVTALFIIPMWVIIGTITMGMLWPPQVRKKILTVGLTTLVTSDQQERIEEIGKVRNILSDARQDITMEIDKGRVEIRDIKLRLDSTKIEIRDEMNNVKEIVTQLFECVTEMG